MLKAYKYRIYPNKQQQELIQKTFGCCRFVYNHTLAYKIKKYKEDRITLSKFDCNNYKNQVLKQEYKWLQDVDSYALINAVFNIDNAFQRFFKNNSSYPKFKNKRDSKKSYKTNCTYNSKPTIEVNFDNNKIKLPKLKWVKAKIHRKFNGKIKSATISQVSSGKYYVSILIETDHTPLNYSDHRIGVDLGIKDLVITSNGNKFDNQKIIYRYEKQLAKLQRQLSRKIKGSANWDKQRIKIAKLYEKITNIRKDNLHKISHKLINENQVIVSEDLKTSSMVKKHNLAKSIYDCSWYELTRQLQYKSEWNNRQYVKVDTHFPSSQLCNHCGYRNTNTKNLSVREWTCPECGTMHDRDINAAINILNEGLRLLQYAS